jgi:hypothetical protein
MTIHDNTSNQGTLKSGPDSPYPWPELSIAMPSIITGNEMLKIEKSIKQKDLISSGFQTNGEAETVTLQRTY